MEEEKREKVGRGRRRSPISQADDDDDDDDGDIFTQWKKGRFAKTKQEQPPAPATETQPSPPRLKIKFYQSGITNLSRIPEPPILEFPVSSCAESPSSILGDVVKESEANLKQYATIALDEWSSIEKASFELVGCGPIASGVCSEGRFLHLNFKARNCDDPAALVETFFAELIKTNTDVVELSEMRCLGPSSSLPDNANTYGCMYCSSHNIHHPDEPDLNAFHNGREDHWKALESQIMKLREFIFRSQEGGLKPTLPHPGFKYFAKRFKKNRLDYATTALRLFNSVNKGANFKLVNTGPYRKNLTSLSWVVHTNFEAENQDDPAAPIHMFFAELLCGLDYVFAVVCKCLGPSVSLQQGEANLQGCVYCDSLSIHHPLGVGYLNGREYLPM